MTHLAKPKQPTTAKPNSEPEITWTHTPRIEPGEYPGYSRSAKVYRDGDFKRWVCAVQFDVLTDDLTGVRARLTWFLNLGDGEKPHAGRRGHYWPRLDTRKWESAQPERQAGSACFRESSCAYFRRGHRQGFQTKAGDRGRRIQRRSTGRAMGNGTDQEMTRSIPTTDQLINQINHQGRLALTAVSWLRCGHSLAIEKTASALAGVEGYPTQPIPRGGQAACRLARQRLTIRQILKKTQRIMNPPRGCNRRKGKGLKECVTKA